MPVWDWRCCFGSDWRSQASPWRDNNSGRGPPAAPAAATKAQPLHYTNVRRLPDEVTLATLSNGLTVIVQENHAAPVATVRCFVKNTGSAYEGKNLGAGLSHVLEHVVAGGTTTHRSEKEIEKIIDTFGGATNAFTSNEMTVFFIDCPAKNVLKAVELLADSMQHVAFEPAEFNRELKVVRRELADNEVDRQHVLWNLLQQTVYTTHPARHPVDRLSRSAQSHDEPDDHRLLPRAIRAEQPGVRRRGRREDAGGARRGGQAIRRHAARPGDLRRVGGRAGAAFAARGDPRDGRRHLRHGVRLADGEAFQPRSVRAWTWRRPFSARARARGSRSGCGTRSKWCWASTRPARRRITSTACSP